MTSNEYIAVDVIDVTTKSTIRVPISFVRVTSVTPNLLPYAVRVCATADGIEATPLDLDGDGKPGEIQKPIFTLCELYQKGRCERKEKCRHVHVDPEFLVKEREKHQSWMQMNAEAFALMPVDKTFEVFNATIKEVMEVPHCQLEYTRGLFLSPEDRDKKVPTNSSANTYCGKVPTACLLFLNGTCKWGEHCNQAHINRDWLQNRNHEFESWMAARKAEFDSIQPTDYINAYHPTLYEVVRIPKLHIVQFTRGLFQAGDKLPSVCLLFQNNRCSCGELCKQIHASSEWMAAQRKPTGPNRKHRGTRNEKPGDQVSPSIQATTPISGTPNTSFGYPSPGLATVISPMSLQPIMMADSPGSSGIENQCPLSPLALSPQQLQQQQRPQQQQQRPSMPAINSPLTLSPFCPPMHMIPLPPNMLPPSAVASTTVVYVPVTVTTSATAPNTTNTTSVMTTPSSGQSPSTRYVPPHARSGNTPKLQPQQPPSPMMVSHQPPKKAALNAEAKPFTGHPQQAQQQSAAPAPGGIFVSVGNPPMPMMAIPLAAAKAPASCPLTHAAPPLATPPPFMPLSPPIAPQFTATTAGAASNVVVIPNPSVGTRVIPKAAEVANKKVRTPTTNAVGGRAGTGPIISQHPLGPVHVVPPPPPQPIRQPNLNGRSASISVGTKLPASNSIPLSASNSQPEPSQVILGATAVAPQQPVVPAALQIDLLQHDSSIRSNGSAAGGPVMLQACDSLLSDTLSPTTASGYRNVVQGLTHMIEDNAGSPLTDAAGFNSFFASYGNQDVDEEKEDTVRAGPLSSVIFSATAATAPAPAQRSPNPRLAETASDVSVEKITATTTPVSSNGAHSTATKTPSPLLLPTANNVVAPQAKKEDPALQPLLSLLKQCSTVDTKELPKDVLARQLASHMGEAQTALRNQMQEMQQALDRINGVMELLQTSGMLANTSDTTPTSTTTLGHPSSASTTPKLLSPTNNFSSINGGGITHSASATTCFTDSFNSDILLMNPVSYD